MSQAALNTRNSEEEALPRRNNGTSGGDPFPADRFNDSVGERLGRVGLDGRCATPAARAGVDGERHYTRNDDIRQSILALGEPGTFMTQDVNIIQTQIEQRLPWIKQVSVRAVA